MNDMLLGMQRLEEKIIAWAQGRDDIRVVLVVGSRARSDHPADEWADLDIGFTTTQPTAYLSSNAWLSEIGNVWLVYPDPVGVTRHVLFEGGLDAGLAPIPHNGVTLALRFVPALRRLPFVPSRVRRGIERQLAEAAAYLRRGVRVIVDKDGVADRFLALLPTDEPPPERPSEADFETAVKQFWFDAVWTAKHLRRGELWHAKCGGLDGRMKTLLLGMMEWHARVAEPQRDTWQNGRFLEGWADPRAVEALHQAFAHYNEDDAWRALIATMDLYRWVALETAERLGYGYPAEADAKVTGWVKECFGERPAAPGG